MSRKILSCSVTGCTGIRSINVSQSHDSACAVANITCINTSLDVGDSINVSLGYVSDGNTLVFKGYVKSIERATPQGEYTVTAHDVMTRAVDFFIVSTSPEKGFTYSHISAENLVREVLEMAGLSSFDLNTSYFTFGINNDVEVNLVSSYDYSRMISDLMAWMIWADRAGTIHFTNRKPYPMHGTYGESSQPGYEEDGSIGTIQDDGTFSLRYGYNEKDLRNKVVVYGAENLYAEAKSSTSYDPTTGTKRQILPTGFYKTIVCASPLIESESFANNACEYNLSLYNKLTYEMPITVEGNGIYEARKCVDIDSDATGISGDWYIYQCEHSFSNGGYLCNLLLRK